MKTISKILSVLLVLAMVLSFVSVISAEETTETMSIVATGGTLDGKTITWTSDNFEFKNEQGGNTNAIRTTDTDHFRVYQDNKTTISALNGKKISKIVITCSAASYTDELQTSASAYNPTVSGSTVTLTPTEATESVSFSASAQWRLKKIEVTLVSDSGSEPDVPAADPNVSTEGWNGDGHTTGWTVKDGVIKGDRTVSGSTHRIWKELITDADNYVVSVDMAFSTKTDIYVKVMGVRVDFDARSGHGAQFIPKYECGGWHDLDGWVEATSGNVKFERVQGGDVTITFTCGDNVKTATVTPTETGNLNVELGNEDGNGASFATFSNLTVTTPEAPVETVAIADGTYHISAAGKFLASLGETQTYGYPNAVDTADSTCVYTVVNASNNQFYLKDAYGRFVYNTGTYKNFSSSATQPAAGGLWMVIKSGDKQLLVSVETNKAMQYGASYGTFQFVDDHATADAVTFTATASEPSQTGDASMIVAAAVVAVMSAAGMALLLKKKEI